MNRLPAHQSTGADGTKSAIPSNMIEHTESEVEEEVEEE